MSPVCTLLANSSSFTQRPRKSEGRFPARWRQGFGKLSVRCGAGRGRGSLPAFCACAPRPSRLVRVGGRGLARRRSRMLPRLRARRRRGCVAGEPLGVGRGWPVKREVPRGRGGWRRKRIWCLSSGWVLLRLYASNANQHVPPLLPSEAWCFHLREVGRGRGKTGGSRPRGARSPALPSWGGTVFFCTHGPSSSPRPPVVSDASPW